MTSRAVTSFALAVMLVLPARDASACAVCFTPADPAITESLNAGILVLLGVTAGVLAGFVRFILSLMRRARNTGPVGEPLA